MYYLGSIPDPICVCKKWKPGRVSHKPSATGWSKSWYLEGQVTKQRMQRSWVMAGVDNSPSPLRPSWAEHNRRPYIVPNTLLGSRLSGPQSSPPWTGRLQSQWENRRWLVAATVLKLSQWRQWPQQGQRGILPERSGGLLSNTFAFSHLRSHLGLLRDLTHSHCCLPGEVCPISLC